MATVRGYRNPSPQVITQEDFDLDPNGNPLLPPNGTTQEPPSYDAQTSYLAIVNNQWVIINKPVVTETLELKKQRALEHLKRYKDWYLNSPVTYDNHEFDNDEISRNRLTQAKITYQITNVLPQAWMTTNNTPYPITNISQIDGIITTISQVFQQRFFEVQSIKTQIIQASTLEEFNAINIPELPRTF